jgi:hypothetical protein
MMCTEVVYSDYLSGPEMLVHRVTLNAGLQKRAAIFTLILGTATDLTSSALTAVRGLTCPLWLII